MKAQEKYKMRDENEMILVFGRLLTTENAMFEQFELHLDASISLLTL